ncbi:LamG domain-containing protein [Methanoregula sp.]|uniref:LamG domain-containing protein n=1 Tax=Methanoregula sp. TaxID=2052170 RepID=UPI002BC62452|nr:LamG domain-containing protein [Methanoregula sp.]HVP96964.1 LamG domain-containing protein [Methanoregula sp.]
MTKRDPKTTRGISEISAEIMIILLVLVIAAIAYGAFSGALNPLFTKKSVYVAGSAGIATIPQSGGISDDVLTFLPKAGDLFYLTGQTSGATGRQVTLQAISPTGQVLYPDASSLNGTLYGKTLYIYPNNTPSSTQCNYAISTSAPTGALRPMALGTWTVRMIDPAVNVIVGSYTGQVKNGATALPVAGGFLTSGTGMFYDVNCNPITEIVNGALTTSNTGPGNMTVTHFNGASSITIPDSTGLGFTGDMSISMWFNPSEAVPYSSSGSGWQQLIGKGLTNSAGSSSSDENDNYQLFQLGNQLLFEWNDAVTGQHYQAITTTTPVQANQWNYVTATVSGGQLTIYDNGVAQPLVYDNSNVPYSNPVSGPVTVNLENNNNNVNIGEQNAASPGNDFYYNGYIGSTALYNRALTTSEIAANYAGYTA